MFGRLVWLTVVAGCGRVSFDTGIDFVGRCDEPWGTPRLIDTGGIALRAPTVTTDDLEMFAHDSSFPTDIFTMTRSSRTAAWSLPRRLPAPPNTESSEASPSISDDGLDLYLMSATANAYVYRAHRETRDAPFAAFEGTGSYGDADVAAGQLEIYHQDYMTPIGRSTRASRDEAFGNFTALGPAVNDGSGNSGPSISHDRLDLYFHSDRDERRQIYVAHRATTEDEFTEVELVELDVRGDVAALLNPEISADGRHLYFEIERPTGSQLYVAGRCDGSD